MAARRRTTRSTAKRQRLESAAAALESTPNDALLASFAFLDGPGLATAAVVCRRWSDLLAATGDGDGGGGDNGDGGDDGGATETWRGLVERCHPATFEAGRALLSMPMSGSSAGDGAAASPSGPARSSSSAGFWRALCLGRERNLRRSGGFDRTPGGADWRRPYAGEGDDRSRVAEFVPWKLTRFRFEVHVWRRGPSSSSSPRREMLRVAKSTAGDGGLLDLTLDETGGPIVLSGIEAVELRVRRGRDEVATLYSSRSAETETATGAGATATGTSSQSVTCITFQTGYVSCDNFAPLGWFWSEGSDPRPLLPFVYPYLSLEPYKGIVLSTHMSWEAGSNRRWMRKRDILAFFQKGLTYSKLPLDGGPVRTTMPSLKPDTDPLTSPPRPEVVGYKPRPLSSYSLLVDFFPSSKGGSTSPLSSFFCESMEMGHLAGAACLELTIPDHCRRLLLPLILPPSPATGPTGPVVVKGGSPVRAVLYVIERQTGRQVRLYDGRHCHSYRLNNRAMQFQPFHAFEGFAALTYFVPAALTSLPGTRVLVRESGNLKVFFGWTTYDPNSTMSSFSAREILTFLDKGLMCNSPDAPTNPPSK